MDCILMSGCRGLHCRLDGRGEFEAIISHQEEQTMLDHTFDAENSILFIRPESSLSEGDFMRLAETVDPHIAAGGALGGIIIEAPKFPGWESVGAMAAHFRFVRDHHK